MKSKTCLLSGLTICFASLFTGGIGLVVGILLFGNYSPPWQHYSIQSAPAEIVDIVHIDIQSTLDDPTGDILYVASKEGIVYSNSLYQDKWLVIDPVPNWDDDPTNLTECATEWADHPLAAPPSVDGVVVDSAGVRFERPLSSIWRCYVLLDDGRLQVWVHSSNVFDLLANWRSKIICTAIGGMLGIITGVFIVRFRKQKAEKVET
jgi:hypothetical protein